MSVVNCNQCNREVGVAPGNGTRYRHKNRAGTWCVGSKRPPQWRPSPGLGQEAAVGKPMEDQMENMRQIFGCAGCGGPDCVCAGPEQGLRDLESWWAAWSAREAAEVTRKAREYGSNSLQEQGRLLAELRGWADDEFRPVDELLELGCFDYAHGKMQRVKDAILRGELPSEDTWKDIAVYALMVLRIRECGTWPGPIAEEDA